jgi:hypothetical protein
LASRDTSIGSSAGIEISNSTIAIVGTVALFGIGAHLLGKWLAPRPQQHAVHVARQTEEPTIFEAMYGEAVATASHPETVHRNADRVQAAIKQRTPRIQQLVSRAHNGDIGPDKVAEGVRNNVQDVMDQLEIPTDPHPSAASPELKTLFEAQRQSHLTHQFNVPGGLILDPSERRWLDHQAMSYAVTRDPQARVVARDAARDAREAARLGALRQRQAQRQAQIHARELEQLGDINQRTARLDSRADILENKLTGVV